MNRSELHFTARRPLAVRLRNWALALIATAALLAIYAAVTYREDALTQRATIQAHQARDGCPATYRGLMYSFSTYETINIMQQPHTRVACYYSKGTTT